MRKKSQDELGTLVTREMKVMLQDEDLTKEQRFDVLAAVMFDTPVKNSLLASFAKSLKAGFELVNRSRYKAIERDRERRKNIERRRRKLGYLDPTCTDMTDHDPTCTDMTSHDGLVQNKTRQGISPYKPPKGGGKLPDKVRPEDLVGKPGKKNGAASRAEPTPQNLASRTYFRAQLTYDIMQTEAFGHMRASERNLKRVLIPLVEKNSARLDEWRQEVMDGLDAWTEAWKADDWQYAPGKITKWLADEKYLQPPRKKAAPAEGSGCGECGAEIA